MTGRAEALRIAILSEVFLPKIDGVTNRLRYTIPELRRRGHAVAVFAPADADSTFGGEPVYRVPGVPFPPEPRLRVSLPSPAFARALRRFVPDVVHALAPTCLGAMGLVTARALGVPRVASFHTDLPRYLPRYGLAWARPAVWPFLRAVHGLADLTLCPSAAARRELRARGIAVAGLWRGGVDTERFRPGRRSALMRERLASRPDRPLVVVAGRLAPEKGLEALLEIVPRNRKWSFAFLGDGPVRPELERQLSHPHVRFLGFLEGEAYAAALASADALFHPSTTETMGFVVLEAMASGCVVVAARAGAIPERVADGVSGWLFAPGNARAGEARLSDALADEAGRRVMVAEARKRACEADWERETDQLEAVYRRLVGR